MPGTSHGRDNALGQGRRRHGGQACPATRSSSTIDGPIPAVTRAASATTWSRSSARDRVFMDVGILGGEDWVAAIERALGASGAMLAIIGPNWSSSRLEDPGDRLRQELEAAMALGVEIIPVLVAGARMPHADDLPPSIRDLSRQQAVRLTDEGWEDDVRRLTGRLAQIVGPWPGPGGRAAGGRAKARAPCRLRRDADRPGDPRGDRIRVLPVRLERPDRSQPEDHDLAGINTTRIPVGAVFGTGYPTNTDIEIIITCRARRAKPCRTQAAVSRPRSTSRTLRSPASTT